MKICRLSATRWRRRANYRRRPHVPERPGLSLNLDPDVLRPFVEAVVRETVAVLDAARERTGDRLAFPEAEAARLIGLAPHQLRDLRHRKGIAFTRGVGGRIFYQRHDLLAYLAAHRVEAVTA
jgi:hypothetical protein